MFASARHGDASTSSLLPVVWLGVLGPGSRSGDDLALVLGPTFAPLFGSARQGRRDLVHGVQHVPRHAAAAGRRGAHAVAARRGRPAAALLARRSRTDGPWVATLLTGRHGDRVPADRRSDLADRRGQLHLPDRHLPAERRRLAAAPRRSRDLARPYRAPRGTIVLGVVAAVVWGVSTILGFQQFGLPTVLFGLAFAYCRRRALRLAQAGATGAARACRGVSALAARQAHRRDAAGADARRRRLPARRRRMSRATEHARWSPRSRTSSSPSRC